MHRRDRPDGVGLACLEIYDDSQTLMSLEALAEVIQTAAHPSVLLHLFRQQDTSPLIKHEQQSLYCRSICRECGFWFQLE